MLATSEKESTSLFKIAQDDDVAVALADLPAGVALTAGDARIVMRADVPQGHKVALKDLPMGHTVIKYGFPIGAATKAIAAGDHVHSHNLKTLLDGTSRLEFPSPPVPRETAGGAHGFSGYRRDNGRVGIRNEIWVIPTVGCVAAVAEKIAAAAHKRRYREVDGVYAFAHPFGCSQLGYDLDGTRAILAALAAHPNAGGVLFVGLGCESNQLTELLDRAPFLDRSRLRTVIAQETADEIEAGERAIAELAEVMAGDTREACSTGDLVIGVKCGGSDAFSGLTANPLVGRVTDRIVAGGGGVTLTEIPELFGAEHILARRCGSQAVFDAFNGVISGFKQYFIDHGEPVSENPSPGNIAGGITTLEEKSLGAVQKAGTHAPVSDVIRYGQQAEKKGLTVLEAPGNDAVSSTALAASGAQIILFTTGRGTPLGFPAPTLKIASNSDLAARKPAWIDFDAGALLHTDHPRDIEEDLFNHILAVADGAQTRNEENGERAIAIWKRGVTL